MNKFVEISCLKLNNKIKAKTEWNFCGWAYITGIVIFNKKRMCFCVKGEVEGNTDGNSRCFPLHECWDFELIEGKNE